jgi:hypothetical protein
VGDSKQNSINLRTWQPPENLPAQWSGRRAANFDGWILAASVRLAGIDIVSQWGIARTQYEANGDGQLVYAVEQMTIALRDAIFDFVIQGCPQTQPKDEPVMSVESGPGLAAKYRDATPAAKPSSEPITCDLSGEWD